MLWQDLSTRLSSIRELPAIATRHERISFGDVFSRASAVAGLFSRLARERVGVYFQDGPDLLITLIALDALGAEAYLIGGEWSSEKAQILAERFELREVLSDRAVEGARFTEVRLGDGSARFPELAKKKESQVVIFTSGTTGEPKGAVHTWSSLAAGIKVHPKFVGSHWLATYGLTRFAGLQVFLQAFLNGACLLISPGSDVDELARLIERYGVENVSGTPTFWRKFLMGLPPEQRGNLPLKQITLGGEIVGQVILGALSASFPQAQITHIYASTEAGVCFSVRDAKEGFPVEYLDNGNERLAFRVENGELMIRSKRAMASYVGQNAPGEWIASGDLVDVRGERVYFLGRKSDLINVGGSKVFPAEVEEEIKKVPGVVNVRVSGRRSSFAGQLVRAEVVPAADRAEAELKAAILKQCEQTLAPYKRPRLIDFVAALPENESRKIMRSNEE